MHFVLHNTEGLHNRRIKHETLRFANTSSSNRYESVIFFVPKGYNPFTDDYILTMSVLLFAEF